MAFLAPSWSVGFSASSLSEPLISGGQIYLTSRSSSDGASVHALDLSSGDQLRETPVEDATYNLASGVALSGGSLWLDRVADPGSAPCSFHLTGLDASTGKIVTSDSVGYPFRGPVTTGPLAAYTESTVCFDGAYDQPSTLVVLDAATRETHWTYTFPAPASRPRFSGGTIYVSSGGELYAFSSLGCGAETCEPAWVRAGTTGSALVDGRGFEIARVTVDLDTNTTQEYAWLKVFDAESGGELWGTSYTGGRPLCGDEQG